MLVYKSVLISYVLSSFVLRFLICTDNELNISEDSMTSSYRLQNITDVHIVACMQEASEYRRGFVMIKFTLHHRRLDCYKFSLFFLSGLRKDYVSSASQRGCEPPVMLPSYFNTPAEKTDDFTAGSRSGTLSSSCWQPCQSPTSLAKQGFQTSKLSRLHQQVTQFKLLKLAQNQGTHCIHTVHRHFSFSFNYYILLSEASLGVNVEL